MKYKYMCILTLFLIPLFSCTRESIPKIVIFDMEEFNKQEEKWTNSGIKKYSFSYSFDGYMPEFILGNTIVNNENCTVNVNYTDGSENEIEKGSEYYIESIDKIFEFLYLKYKQALEDVNAKLYDSEIFQCKYNNIYGYPEYISISTTESSSYIKNKDGSLIGSSNIILTFRLKDFVITE